LPSSRGPSKANGYAVNTSLLAQELAPLNAQIEQVRQKHALLERELSVVDAELETFSSDKKRFDALRTVCDALDRLEELKADELFWEGLPEAENAAQHLERVRGRVARFEDEISGITEKQESLQGQIDHCLRQLDILYDEIHDAYDREERRKEEFVIEREISPVPYRAMIMPWSREVESERHLRLAVLVALLICSLFGYMIPMITVPIPDRQVAVVEIPKRLAKLVKKMPPIPAPVPKPPEEKSKKTEEAAKKPEEEPKKTKQVAKKPSKAPKPQPKKKKPDKPSKGGGAAPQPRKKVAHVGVLAFKNAFAGLMDETPVAKLGTEARLSKESPRVAGRAVAQRSLVAMQAQSGTSGGIGNAGVSRNVGSGNVDRLGGGGIGKGGGSGDGTGFGRVESTIADLEESSRPLSDGVAPGRTDEEIQIVFDRYKAALYRIYNKELRKDPTLRGKMLLRISIETSGAVSMCKVESTDLASAELVAKIVARIKRFNFGPKEGVPKMTILYPIDFLPA